MTADNHDPFVLAREAEPIDDPVLDLIAEHARLEQIGVDYRTRADEAFCALNSAERLRLHRQYPDRVDLPAPFGALYAEAALKEEAVRESHDRLLAAKPITLGGAIALLELTDMEHEPLIAAVIEGLREIFEREAGPCEIELSELRARAEALAAEYDAPLPEGDVGLIEAEQRLHELDPRREALGEPNTPEIEEIINLAFLAMCRLDERIATRPATTLAGAAVKLRRLLHPELGMDTGGKETDGPCLHHVLSVIERETRP
jgi:hypothetical protein